MAKAQKAGNKSSARSGLQMVGGAAAGAAAGSLMGPLGAAVGAVVGGIAGANAQEIAHSQTVKKLASAAKRTSAKGLSNKAVKKTLKKIPGGTALTRKGPAKSRATKKKGTGKK